MVDGTNTVPYLHRGVRGERIVGTVGAGLVPALGTHKGCPYVVADYVTVFRKWSTYFKRDRLSSERQHTFHQPKPFVLPAPHQA